MLRADCLDNTPQEVLYCEQEQPSGQKKSARKTKHMLKAYCYRLYPDQEQETLLKKHFGCVRHVYHWHETLRSIMMSKPKKRSQARNYNDNLWLKRKIQSLFGSK